MNDDIRRQLLARLDSIIARYGWAVQGVFPTEASQGPAFCYTVGLADKGLPELIVFGLPLPIGQRLMNEMAALLVARKALGQPVFGHMPLEGWPMPFEVVAARPGAARGYTTAVFARSGAQTAVSQVVWPDKLGRLPWHPDAAEAYLLAQPVLGTPEAGA